MEHPWGQGNALSRAQIKDFSSAHCTSTSITIHLNRRSWIDSIIWKRVIELHLKYPTAPVDDVFSLGPMKMKGQALSGLENDHLLCVRSSPLRQLIVTVPQGEENGPEIIEVSRAEISNVPAQAIESDTLAFRPGLTPSFGCPVSKGG